ncbi:ferrichrome ABC transporter substrate-binding protein [Lactiplantibacillus pentosus]|nr:ferrichrome ABC transporter substrate-binding protein [Lactiplantibacillus pentosus]
MVKRWQGIKLGLVVGLACSLLLGACGTTKQTSSTTVTRTDYLKHKVKVPKHPKRVIGSYLEDDLVALGIKPVVQWSVKNGSGTQEYLKKSLKGVPLIDYSLPYEAVTKAKPDLILMGTSSAVANGKYAQYSKIAPTYVVKNGTNVTWRQTFLDVAKAVNRQAKAKKVLAKYDQKVATTRKALKKSGQHKVAVLWVTNNTAYMVNDSSASGALLYGDLKLGEPSLVKQISKSATADWSAVSLEKLAKLDADDIFLVNSQKGAALFKDPLWKNIKAVKNKHLYQYGDSSSWQYSGPIAYSQMIDMVKKDLLK